MNKNTQEPEGVLRNKSGVLELHHIFPTIQGEGPFAGTPAIFVRLSGCNLQCPACDTDYTSIRKTRSPQELFEEVALHKRHSFPLVVITGGEPFRQHLAPFVKLLLMEGYRVQIETNGTLWDDVPLAATIVCSPKSGRINADLAKRVAAFKYVVQAGFVDPTDGLPTMTLSQTNQISVARPPKDSGAEIFVQPLDERDEVRNHANLQATIKSCMQFGYRLCIQTHKLVNLE